MTLRRDGGNDGRRHIRPAAPCRRWSIETRSARASTEEGERLFGAMKNLFEDSTDGDVAGVSGKDEGQTRCWEFEVGGVGECSLCIVEGSSMRRRPC